MGDKDLLNTLVFLTVHAERWIKEASPQFAIPLSNRIARVSKVFDWDTDEGKLLLRARDKAGKWEKLTSKDFKFVLSVFYPELVKDGRHGLIIDEMLPRMFPGTDLELFTPVPDWMLKDLREEKVGDAFSLIPKKPAKKSVKKSAKKKSPAKKKTKKAKSRVS